eukprot:3547348-Pyramimonas_sp.AAC.1
MCFDAFGCRSQAAKVGGTLRQDGQGQRYPQVPLLGKLREAAVQAAVRTEPRLYPIASKFCRDSYLSRDAHLL